MPSHRAGTSNPKPIGTYSQQYRYIWWSIQVTLQIEVREHGQELLGLRGFSMYLCVGEGQDSITKCFQSAPCGLCNCPVFIAQRTIRTAHAYTHSFTLTYLLIQPHDSGGHCGSEHFTTKLTCCRGFTL